MPGGVIPAKHPTMRRSRRTGLAAALVLGTALGTAPAGAALPATTDLTLSYAAYVDGFRAMLITVELRTDGDRYSVALHDHTVGLVGAMIDNHVASVATGRFDGAAAMPQRYTSAGHSRGADRETVLDYQGGNPVVTRLSPPEPNRDRVPAAATTGSIDALSAMAEILHALASSGRCEARLHVFDGARLTDVQAWTAGETTLQDSDRSPYSGHATVCDFRTQELAGFLHDGNYVHAHDPQGGSVWLAPVLPGLPKLPIRAQFSTLEHGEIGLFLLGAKAG